jgi:hypothetical protein
MKNSAISSEYERLKSQIRPAQLDVLGGFHPGATDGAPAGCKTVLLLGPLEPGFWPVLTASAEFQDGRSDPVDRWSSRVISQLAQDLGATPVFPFGGPPWHPFISWALRSTQAFSSPVSLLVHDRAGLMVSYRGALAFSHHIELPATSPSPCPGCKDRPCVTACPAGAITEGQYDVAACHAFLDTAEGQDCLQGGCLVRRACPVSKTYARNPAQSAFHMAAFHR